MLQSICAQIYTTPSPQNTITKINRYKKYIILCSHLSISARRSFGRWPVRYAVARTRVKAEQLCAHSIVFLQDKQAYRKTLFFYCSKNVVVMSHYCACMLTHETGTSPSVFSALGVQSQ